MCGIFGIAVHRDARLGRSEMIYAVKTLFQLSESRGKEASGLAFRQADRLVIHKAPVAASALLDTATCRSLLEEAVPEGFPQASGSCLGFIGHARLTTNGYQGIRENNQPVRALGVTGVHNGIIVNVDALWDSHPELLRQTGVDTEVFMALLGKRLAAGESLPAALAGVYAAIQGSASMGLLFEDRDVLALATNTGSLHVCQAEDGKSLFFASEGYFLRALLRAPFLDKAVGAHRIERLEPGTGLTLDLISFAVETFALSPTSVQVPTAFARSVPVAVFDTILAEEATRLGLRRCTRCILPETMPFIDFDEAGVCNYCRDFTPIRHKGREALEEVLRPFRSKAGRPDCIVAFSGGRDSSYSLHYLVEEMGLHPIAYTYDWGMVNDLARRNQARITGKLGVEQIIVSADIKRKRRNIRLNVEAWLRRPDLGLVPLFMAGDKHFFYYANVLKKQTGIRNAIWAENQLERTNFKVGFCGIGAGNRKERIYRMSAASKAALIAYYFRGFLKNPWYVNRSLWDTALSYASYYLINHDYLWFSDYIPWDEDAINSILLGIYDWEVDPESSSTWRIGDGTAAFYNFIYYTVAGFSEHDTFRSNQIRQGVLTRERALELATRENQPRYQGIMEYCQLIGVDFDLALSVVNAMPKLYGTAY